MTEPEPLPLAGVRVLDLTALLPGPICTLHLAELGADVVKVERPGGDVIRQLMTGVFETINRGKKCLELDLRSAEGVLYLERLIDQADVLVESFRPGGLAKLGFDSARLVERNPRLIYVSLSGYGQSGPLAGQPGHDVNYLGLSGLLAFSGSPDGPPEASGGIPIADLGGALYATLGILSLLLRRQKTGRGGVIDVPLAATALKLAEVRLAAHIAEGSPEKSEFMGRGAYGVFVGGDGGRFTLGCMEQHFWRRLCQVLGADELADDSRFRTYADRCRSAALVNEKLQGYLLLRSSKEWIELLSAADIPVGPVLEPDELGADPQVASWGLLHERPGYRAVDLPLIGLDLAAGHAPVTIGADRAHDPWPEA
ncbi:CoA transferase [Jatrophihabitans sp.]|uniref:CaiB/BaiF CoA transferase family protein n=1 Tax=Jatrophihabitans sp. TaxID=1932789 RepID=UPI0030C73A84